MTTFIDLAGALDRRGLVHYLWLTKPHNVIGAMHVREDDNAPVPDNAVVMAPGLAAGHPVTALASTASDRQLLIVTKHPRPENVDASWVQISPNAGWADVIAIVHDRVAAASDDHPAQDLFDVADRAATIVGGAVTIEDDDGNLLAYSRDDAGADQIRVATIMARCTEPSFLRALTTAGVLQRIYASAVPVKVDGVHPSARPRLALGLRAADVQLGVMWAMTADSTPTTQAAFADIGQTAASQLLQRLDARRTASRWEQDHLAVLLHNGVLNTAVSQTFSLSTSGQHRVAVIDITTTDPTERAVVRARIDQRLSGAGEPPIQINSGQLSNLRYLVMSVPASQSLTDDEAERYLRRLFADRGTGRPLAVAVGIGRPVDDLGQLPTSRREAEQALTVVRADPTPGLPWSLSRSWSRAALLQAIDPALLAALDTLSPLRLLRRHDAEHGTQLVATLAAWLRCQGNIREAAESLHLHGNSLRYRMQRVQQVLGADLLDPDVRLVFTMQLQERPPN